MTNNKILISTILAIFFSLSITSTSSLAGENLHCKAEFRKCKSINGICVWVGIPLESNCDKNCQIKIMRNIQNKFKVGVLSGAAPKEPSGCVGFRSDIDGTKNGAMCLADRLGLRFDPIGCNISGYAYNVMTD